MAPPRHIKNDINIISGQEPADKESIEHKDWELAYLKLQLERKRTTIRIAREGKQKQIAALETRLESSLEALRKSKEHEIKAKEHEIEGLKQERNHYRDMASFRQVAENGDAVVQELNIKIDELESHIDHQNGIIQELEALVAELQAKNLQLTASASDASQNMSADTILRENQEHQFTILARDAKILRLETEKADYVERDKKMMAQIDTLLKDNLALQTQCRKLHEQVGSTAKPTLKSKTVYQRKPNLTQKSLNTMFHDQITASSPASTQSAPSPIVSTSHIASNLTTTRSTTASPTIDESNENTNKIPLKRALSATLTDKTNSRVPVLIRKDNKEKGRAVEVKQEQVDIDMSTALENVPDQTVHTTRDTSSIRKKPKSNTSITTASTSTVRRTTVKPTSAPTTPAPPFTTCNTSHRKDRSNMIGGTCTACANFYGTETITANIDGHQLELTGQDRIQHNSRHRHHRNQRSNTPPGFWDLDFQTPGEPGF